MILNVAEKGVFANEQISIGSYYSDATYNHDFAALFFPCSYVPFLSLSFLSSNYAQYVSRTNNHFKLNILVERHDEENVIPSRLKSVCKIDSRHFSVKLEAGDILTLFFVSL